MNKVISGKDIGIILSSGVLIFFLFHYNSILAYLPHYGVQASYEQGKYERIIDQYRDAEDMTSLFNRATGMYKLEDRQQAHELFEQVLAGCEDEELCFDARYNKGNSSFYRGTTMQNIQQKKMHREQAVESYDEALRIRPDDEQALHNKQVVQDLLEQLSEENPSPEQQQQQGDDGEQGENSETGQEEGENQEGQEGDESEQGEEQGASDGQEGENSEESEGQQGGSSPQLSEQQRAELEQYQEQLEQQQRQAQQFFNKQPQNGAKPNDTMNMLDAIFGRPQLEQGWGGDPNEEDW